MNRYLKAMQTARLLSRLPEEIRISGRRHYVKVSHNHVGIWAGGCEKYSFDGFDTPAAIEAALDWVSKLDSFKEDKGNG